MRMRTILAKGPRDHWTGNDLGKILRKQLRIARFCARTVCVRNNVAVAATRTRCPIRTPARGRQGGPEGGPAGPPASAGGPAALLRPGPVAPRPRGARGATWAARRPPGAGVTAYAWHVTVTASDALLEDLNPQQRAAVVHEGSPLLIVAGAGSGKTRVLTRRMAYLMAERGISPGQILPLPFTHKPPAAIAA